MKNKKGFTLTEILAVIAIIAVLTSIAIPSILLVRKRINERAYESKKSLILLAAQEYGQNNTEVFDENGEFSITIGELIQYEYLEKDIDYNGSKCTANYGCVIDPRDKTSMNDIIILLRNNNNIIASIWQGTLGLTLDRDLVTTILDELNCTPTATSPCLYSGDSMNNYLDYSGVMWRILGVYVIDGEQVVKLITNDIINVD
jgi:prepilin-type N-terminal cleavage/methylation domain-containing protein